MNPLKWAPFTHLAPSISVSEEKIRLLYSSERASGLTHCLEVTTKMTLL